MKNLIKILRLPPAKILFAHQLGLTVALILIVLNLLLFKFEYPAPNVLYLAIVFLIFLAGTYFGGWFGTSVLVLGTVSIVAGTEWSIGNQGFWSMFLIFCEWYSIGYVSGMITAMVYNMFVFNFVKRCESNKIKLSFVYDKDNAFNIIRSPISEELKAYNQPNGHRHYQPAFTMPTDCIPEHPYTILFIANPLLKRRNGGQWVQGQYLQDPLLNNENIFYHTVEKALQSFEKDEVLGSPDIWTRVRVITIFEPALADPKSPIFKKLALPQARLNLVDKFGHQILEESRVISNVLAPMPNMAATTFDVLDYLHTGLRKEVDVIYCLSASNLFVRSSALYSDYPDDYDESTSFRVPGKDSPRDKKFEVQVDPAGELKKQGVEPDVVKAVSDSILRKDYIKKKIIGAKFKHLKHECYAEVPGRVALNVITARNKTYIHEFAHAMSSAINGAIVDEYADEFKVVGSDTSVSRFDSPLYINCLERRPCVNGKLIPIPKKFMNYDGLDYFSDFNHPSALDGWLSYFPERLEPKIPCTMDTSYDTYRFDKMISAFMFDRLITKINR